MSEDDDDQIEIVPGYEYHEMANYVYIGKNDDTREP